MRIIPTVNRFFFIPTTDLHLNNPQTIPANQFINDSGNPVTSFPDLDHSSYLNLYINGILQEGGLYRLSTDALTIAPTGDSIYAGTSIIIETVQFSLQLIS
jgi:hypothetical protein